MKLKRYVLVAYSVHIFFLNFIVEFRMWLTRNRHSLICSVQVHVSSGEAGYEGTEDGSRIAAENQSCELMLHFADGIRSTSNKNEGE